MGRVALKASVPNNRSDVPPAGSHDQHTAELSPTEHTVDAVRQMNRRGHHESGGGDSGRHLDDGQQRVHALEGLRFHGHAEHRQVGERGAHSRQVVGSACSGDDAFQSALPCPGGIAQVRQFRMANLGKSRVPGPSGGVFRRHILRDFWRAQQVQAPSMQQLRHHPVGPRNHP